MSVNEVARAPALDAVLVDANPGSTLLLQDVAAMTLHQNAEAGEIALDMDQDLPRKSSGKGIRWHEGDNFTHEFDDSHLWLHDPNETAKDMIDRYKDECAAIKVRPIAKLLEQLERLDDVNTPIDTLDLKGVRLDNRSCEVLEAVLSRVQMLTLDLQRTNLEDEGAIALCEMIEFYGCASRVILSGNNRLRPRAWLTIGRMLKKSPFISMISVSYCGLEEQTLTLLLRSVRANCALQVLRLEGNNLTGKGTFILMAAMKFNENLQELWLGSNHLCPEDGQHLGSILRTNHTLRIMDVRDNNLQDAGVRYICAGVAEQVEGLQTLNLTSNNIGHEGFHHISAMLPCTKSLRELNISHNKCGDNGLFMLKLGLLANRTLEKLNLSNTKMTCEGAIALAEVLAESKHVTHLDLKDNDIRVAGLMALQLGHRMNQTLLCMETPKSYKVDQRDRPIIKDLLTEIDRYCGRNLVKRDEKIEAERRRQHEAQHAQLGSPANAEQGALTAGEIAAQEGQQEEEEEEKEVDPSIVGSLDNVYKDEPGLYMKEDPFKKVPMMDDHEKPASMMAMEKSVDAMVALVEHTPGSPLPEDAAMCLDKQLRDSSAPQEDSAEDLLEGEVGAAVGHHPLEAASEGGDGGVVTPPVSQQPVEQGLGVPVVMSPS